MNTDLTEKVAESQTIGIERAIEMLPDSVAEQQNMTGDQATSRNNNDEEDVDGFNDDDGYSNKNKAAD
jgi:hypothetical protein